MFIHNLKYTVKILFKNKVLIFWMFAFPIILGIFFHMAFENIEKDEALQVFDIAVIDNKEYQNQTIYQETFKELSDKKNKDQLFRIHFVNKKEADRIVSSYDKARENYYNYHTSRKWGEYRNYNLSIDSSYISEEEAANLIADYVERRTYR